MSVGHFFIHATLVALAVAIPVGAALAGSGSALPADLRALSQRTVFFGHQSVGGNVLEGLGELAAGEGIPLRVVELRHGDRLAAATFGHELVPENGDPLRKLRSFEEAFTSGRAAGAEIAFVKLCYVDFHSGTDVPALFAQYQETLRRLEARFPGITFVHLTAPLTTADGGLAARVRDLLGKDSLEAQNARRHAFNQLMRQAFQGSGRLFDLARLEATGPDGRRRTFSWKGGEIEALSPAFTDDGGHLNAAGRRHVARALVAFLAAVPGGASP